jgi:GNAT superfamily N-acetyltransferase
VKLLRRAAAVWREDGVRTLLAFGAGVLGFRSVCLLARRLDSSMPGSWVPSGIQLGVLETSEVAGLAARRPHGPSTRWMHEWMEQGSRCFVARRDGCVVGTRWAERRQVDLSTFGRSLPLRPGEVCFFDAFTAPGERGRGIYRALTMFSDAECQREGCTLALTFTHPHNTPSLRAVKAAGYQELARMRRWQIGRWSGDTCRPM